MHLALQIPELALRVVDHVDPRAKRTLVSFALACRSFEAAGLDAVWRDPGADTLEYILACFPSDALAVSSASGFLSVELVRPVTLADWRRPMLYCSRVRVLRIGPRIAVMTGYNAAPLGFLSGTMPADSLFPRLEHLCWSTVRLLPEEEKLQTGNFLRALLSPSLKTLQMQSITAYDLTMLPRIAQRCASLTRVEIDAAFSFDPGFHAERAAISVFVLSLNRLTSLTVPSLDSPALTHLALLPHLEELEIQGFTHDISVNASVDHDLAFPSLRELSISAAHIPATLDFLQPIACSPLSGLSFQPLPSSTTQQIAAFYSALSVTAARKSVFRIWHVSGRQDVLWRIPRSALLALATFDGLSSLTLNSPFGFELDEEVISALARGCPLLQDLALQQSSAESTFDIGLLTYFAKYCRRLEQLEATFNTAHVPSSDRGSDDATRSTQNTLDFFHVGHSSLVEGDIPAVASFLTETFPSLRDVYDDLSESHNWEEVEKLLRKLRVGGNEAE